MKILDGIIETYETANISLSGMTDEFFCAYISKLFIEKKDNILIITPSLYEANKICNTLKNYNNDVLLFPMDDFLTSESIAISPELKSTRLDTLSSLCDCKKKIVVCHLDSFLRYLPSKEKFMQSKLNISVGDVYPRDRLLEDITRLGYKRETIVTNTGEVGIRGFVFDIFPLNNDFPIRIEFFDDEIESIRFFDPETQKSIKSLENVVINPNTEFLADVDLENAEYKQKELPLYNNDICNIEGYFSSFIRVIKDYSQLKANYNKTLLDITEYKHMHDGNYNGNYMFDLNDFELNNSIFYNTVENYTEGKIRNYTYDVKKVPLFHEAIDVINDYIEKQLLKGFTIVVCLKENQSKAFLKYLRHKYVLTSESNIYDKQVNVINKSMNEGFIYGKYVFITQKELFNKVSEVKYKNKFKYSTKIKSLDSIEPGDYVVHALNGIGIYNGIKTLNKNGLKKDYLEIKYSGSDKLYIPVEKMQLIGKFTGKEGIVPKINKLGSSEWQKTKLRVRNKVHNIAKQLLELYAKRKIQKGFSFSKDDEYQTLFESEFEYQETSDQLRSINQIKKEMESSSPMDMLLCGDVGYGKTEVAFRAIFKAVNDSKQVLYLCPTTILSNQQYNNAKERFSNFPISIELLNRYTSTKKTKQILRDLSEGKIDVLFGTHRILSNDIIAKDLGLLIVDEEQRFGVVHKEKIKHYKENVDVLTLTATPIPRTLQMSLVGMRSLSLIETPPVDRYPIQTYVIEENKALIKDAIYKELSRNGQVFILYNNVKDIENKVFEIQQLVPEARIVYTHGQLSKNELEEKMKDFINYEYDIMVCTTIIETGIDINNANTLIIYDADHFGLSQLYQIRGRVGRSNKIAYAYLMYKPNKMLSDIAVKRLQAIKEFTELGSGFSIASRDLSIRGAGDILGSEQAGFIDSIGIDLYLKILNEEVERLKGNAIEEEESSSAPNILDVETHISDSYVDDQELKIEIHKLINTINSEETFNSVKSELKDRFGQLDEKIIIYMYEEWFESLAKKYQIMMLKQNNRSIELGFSKEITDKIKADDLFLSAINLTRNFNFSYANGCLKIILNFDGLDENYIYYLVKLLNDVHLK